MSSHLHTGLLNLEHAALHRVLCQLGGAHRVGVSALDLVAHLIEGGRVARSGHLAHRPQRRADLLLHFGLLQLAEQLGLLGELLLQHHLVLLDRFLGLRRRLQRLIMEALEVLHALLGGDQLRGERLGRIVVLGRLRRIAGGGGLIGQRQRLADVDLQLLDVGELSVKTHLKLTLIADHLGGLLSQCLVLALGLLDGLLNLNFRVGIFVDLRAEQRHQVLPRLDERVGHELRVICFRLCVENCRTLCPCAQFIRSWRYAAWGQATAIDATGGITTLVLASMLTAASARSFRSSCPAASTSTSDNGTSRAPQMAVSSSLDASLRPRSTSDKYPRLTRAASETSRRVRPCDVRARRSTSPITSRSNAAMVHSFAWADSYSVATSATRRMVPVSA